MARMNAGSRSALGELYDSVTAANGWSLRDVERRVADRGGSLRRSRINQLVNDQPLPSVSAEAIDDLAAGLGVSVDRVAVAALQAMGFRVSLDEVTPAEAIMRDVRLSKDTKDALLAILRGAGGAGGRAEGRRGA